MKYYRRLIRFVKVSRSGVDKWRITDTTDKWEITNRELAKFYVEDCLESLIEHLAHIEHKRWARWQKHLHSKCVRNTNGNLTIPKNLVERWEKQIETEYKDLSEKEKDSDRKQVMKYLLYLMGEDDFEVN